MPADNPVVAALAKLAALALFAWRTAPPVFRWQPRRQWVARGGGGRFRPAAAAAARRLRRGAGVEAAGGAALGAGQPRILTAAAAAAALGGPQRHPRGGGMGRAAQRRGARGTVKDAAQQNRTQRNSHNLSLQCRVYHLFESSLVYDASASSASSATSTFFKMY